MNKYQEHNNSIVNNEEQHQKRLPVKRFSIFQPKVAPNSDVETAEVKRSHAGYVFEQMLSMVEPVEFYTIRARAAPKAPSHVRIIVSMLFLFGSIIAFALVVNEHLKGFTVETDIFRKVPISNEWDQCEPITTLGSNWTPFYLFVVDDETSKQIRFNLHNYWFQNRTVCEETIGPTWKAFCTLEPNGFFHVIDKPSTTATADPHKYGVVSCNGKNLDWNNQGTAADCEKNHMELLIKYYGTHRLSEDPYKDCYGKDDRPLYFDMCSAIFDSTNPYKCLKKKYNTLIGSLSEGYAFATFIFSTAVVLVTTVFPMIFRELQEVVIEA